MPATSSTAARNAASLAFDGLVNPLIFLTNCSEAARTSSSVTGGSQLKSVLIFRHIGVTSGCLNAQAGEMYRFGVRVYLNNVVTFSVQMLCFGQDSSWGVQKVRQPANER